MHSRFRLTMIRSLKDPPSTSVPVAVLNQTKDQSALEAISCSLLIEANVRKLRREAHCNGRMNSSQNISAAPCGVSFCLSRLPIDCIPSALK